MLTVTLSMIFLHMDIKIIENNINKKFPKTRTACKGI